jgi:hypothetical protein
MALILFCGGSFRNKKVHGKADAQGLSIAEIT